jgi:hypothetical protein
MVLSTSVFGSQERLSSTIEDLPPLFELSPEDLDFVAGGWGWPKWAKAVATVVSCAVAGAALGAIEGGLPGAIGGAAVGTVVGVTAASGAEWAPPEI